MIVNAFSNPTLWAVIMSLLVQLNSRRVYPWKGTPTCPERSTIQQEAPGAFAFGLCVSERVCRDSNLCHNDPAVIPQHWPVVHNHAIGQRQHSLGNLVFARVGGSVLKEGVCVWGGGWGGHKLGAGFSQFGETKWKFSYFQLLIVCHCFCLCWGGGG